MSTIYLVYGDCGDYYQPEELLGVGETREEAEEVAEAARKTDSGYRAGRFDTQEFRARWTAIEIRETETGKVLP